MSDEHERLVAAVHARRELADQATPGPWRRAADHEMAAQFGADNTVGNWDGEYARQVTVGGGTGQGESADADAKHIAANDPAQILRDTEAHLKILERHPPIDERPYRKLKCRHDRGSGVSWVVDWPCPEVLDVAGIYPEENET